MHDLTIRARIVAAARATSAAQVLVAVFALVVYLQAPWNGRAVDDVQILANPLLASARTLPAALASPWWYATGYLYRPLTLVLLGIQQLVSGGAVWLPHVVNVVLHACVAVLALRLYARFLPLRAACAAALLFAVLPVHAEAVASIVGQAELLSALALLALMLLVSGASSPTRRRCVQAALLSAVALAAKEGGVTAPFLALAVAWTVPAQRRNATRWATAALAGTGALLAARLLVLGTLGGELANPVFRGASLVTRLSVALAMLPRSLAMLTLPVPPAIDDVPTLEAIQHPALLPIVLGVGLVGAALVALWRHRRHPSAATLGICIAAATLAPTANLFFASGVVLSGRTHYAPSIGAGLVLGALIAAAMGGSWLSMRRAVPYALVTVGVWAFVVTWREVPVWRDTDAVLATMVSRQPDNYRSYRALAYTARDAGRPAEAVAQFRAAITLFPSEPEMLTDGATVALQLHDTVTATAWLRLAVATSPRAVRARTRLFGLLRARGDTAAAQQLLRDGLRESPGQRTWQALLAE